MILGIVLLVVGLALAGFGHQTARLQLRTIGAALAAFGAVAVILPIFFG